MQKVMDSKPTTEVVLSPVKRKNVTKVAAKNRIDPEVVKDLSEVVALQRVLRKPNRMLRSTYL
jgi:hypothetical protein